MAAICETFPALRCSRGADTVADYMPVFFQACKGASPVRSSIDTFPIAFVLSPFALISGILIKVVQKYRLMNLAGWIVSIVGFGVLSLLRPDSGLGETVGFQFLMAAGVGIVVRFVERRKRENISRCV